jgi:hypothetical protein
MSLTLDEIKALVSALGAKIPEDIIAQRAKAEEFKTRRGKVAAEAGTKPDNWRLKQSFQEVLDRASESAGKQQFDSALQLLDEAEKLLLQPDAPPEPEPPPSPPAEQPSPTSASPEASSPEPAPAQTAPVEPPATAEQIPTEPTQAEAPPPEPTPAEPEPVAADSSPAEGLLAVWRTAKERVDVQVSQLQGALRQTKDPACLRIAEMGLNGVTGNLQVGLQVALTEYDGSGGHDPKLGAKAAAIVTEYQQFLQSNKVIALCDENPFGIRCDIRGTLLGALAELERSFKS